MKDSQTDRVIRYMQEHGSITQADADRMRIKRLSGRIYDVKKRGIAVSVKIEYGKNEYGPFHYARYSLEG